MTSSVLKSSPLAKVAVTVAVGTLLAGCASFSPDGGMAPVSTSVARDLGKDAVALRTPQDVEFARATTATLLRKPLSADRAVQIALLNNRGLQAAYNDLAIAEARAVEGSLPPNPAISLSRIAGSVEIEIERKIVANVLALATLPMRSEIAATRFRQAQAIALAETLRVGADARRAFYRAVAAHEVASFLTRAQGSARTSAEFAARLGETGAMSKLDQAREQAFHAELTAQLASARQRAASAREALVRSMGLWGDDLGFRMAGTLPRLPKHPQTLPGVEVEAVRRHVDLQVERLELDALAKSYGLTQATRFINVLDAGFVSKTTREKATGERIRDRGFDVELQVPIFDFGEVRAREAEATYLSAVNRLMERAVNVRSEARDAYRAYRSTYDIAMHYEREVLPLRRIISDEMLLRYNGMLVDVFALLTEARQRIAATVASIEARRDFWLAATDLNTAVTGGGSGRGETSRSVSVATTETAGH